MFGMLQYIVLAMAKNGEMIGGIIVIERQDGREFDLVSKYQPTGDQPTAIKQLTEGIEQGEKAQILLGATGLGKLLRFQTSLKMSTNRH